MPKLITSNFRTHIAKQFKESLTESANTIYYGFVARSLPFDDDQNPPLNGNSVQASQYEIFDELIFGKRINPDDVRHMVRKVMWESGTVYQPCRIDIEDLQDKDFFVITEENNTQSQTIEYSLFKCLNNNGGAASTAKPKKSEVTPADEYYRTADGYEWKYMFSIPSNIWNNFNTSKYAPIVENANVVANAVFGTIESYFVEDPGRDYNSYATGFVKAGSVAGNNQIISLAGGTNVTLTLDSVDGFTFEKVTSSRSSEGVVVLVDTEASEIQLGGIKGIYKVGDTIYNNANTASAIVRNVEYEVNSLSANTDFYKGSTIYIRSGKGAGQLREISEYIVTGDERRVLVNPAFDVSVDTTSSYQITPKVSITGDGSGAKAIAIVNPRSQNAIDRIEVIEKGQGYTYADVVVTGNTGFLSTANTQQSLDATSATVSALVAPPGGHGSDAINELYGNRIGVSIRFEGDENGTIPVQNDYRKIGLMKEPLFANVELSIESATGQTIDPTNFVDGETVVSYNALQSEVMLKSFVYTLERYETVTVGDASTFIDGQELYAYTLDANNEPSFVMSGIVQNKSGNDLYMLKNINYTAFSFADADVLSEDSTVSTFGTNSNTTIDAVSTTHTGNNVVIEGRDDFGVNYGYIDPTTNGLPLSIQINVNNLDVTNNVTANTTSIDLSGIDLNANSDSVYVYVKSTNENYSTTDIEEGARAEVSFRTGETLRLRNVRGDFNIGDTITGLKSGIKAKVTGINKTNAVFDQRKFFTVEMVSLDDFLPDEKVIQPETGAEGVIHSINRDTSGSINELGLVITKGTFNVSDAATNTEYSLVDAETQQKKARVLAKDEPDINYGQGEFLYIETIPPVERQKISTERLKLIIEF